MRIRRKDLSRIIQEELKRSLREQKSAELKGGTKKYPKSVGEANIEGRGSACVTVARNADPSLHGRIPIYFEMKEPPFEGAGYKKATVTVENEANVKAALGGDVGSNLVNCVKKALERIHFDPSAPSDPYSFIIRGK